MRIERLEDIEAWQLARELTRNVYGITKIRSFSRDWELRRQITAASGSAMHNIAEGFDGGSSNEFVRFLKYAQRSCREVQSQLYVAIDQDYITQEQFQEIYDLAQHTSSKIGGFVRYLQSCSR